MRRVREDGAERVHVERLNASERHLDLPNRRPRDAATLLVLDGAGSTARVLMGRRRRDLAFMPGMFVFPGGRVDPGDSRVPVAADYPPHVRARLMADMKGPRTEARARAFAVAAIRETFEEAGLVVGRPSVARAGGAAWAAFRERGLLPDLSQIRFVARAITPPRKPRRFDTRFLALPAAAVADRLPEGIGPDDEFEEVCWVTLEEARRLELPAITLTVLDELIARMDKDPHLSRDAPVPFYYWRGRGFVRRLL